MSKAYGFDTETCLIRPGCLAPPLVCVTLASTDGCSVLWRWDEKGAIEEWLLSCLQEDVRIYGANTAYDTAVLCAQYPEFTSLVFELYDQRKVRDVQIDQKLIDLAQGRLGGFVDPETDEFVSHKYSLAALASRVLGIELAKGDDTWRMRYGELRDVPVDQWPEEARSYALKDAQVTLAIAIEQDRYEHFLVDGARQAAWAFALHLASCWGVTTDAKAIAELRKVMERKSAELTSLLQAEGLVRIDGSRDTKAAKKRMFEDAKAAGLPPKLTKTGLEQAMLEAEARGEQCEPWASPDSPRAPHNYLSEEQLIYFTSLDEEACREAQDPVLRAYAERTSVQSYLEQHIPALMRGAGGVPIQPKYDPLVASGRASCKGPDLKNSNPTQYGFQIQNPPRNFGVRECFVARPGYVFLDVDYNQGELRTVAEACWQMVGYSRLGEALNEGRDVHLALGARILGISYEEAQLRKKDKDVKNARQLAKAPNFGFPGGMGPWGMVRFASKSYGVRLTLSRAKELRELWLEEWSEFNEYFAIIRRAVDEGRENGATIEQLCSGRIRGGLRYTVACNTIFQGLLADIAKHALYEVTRECMVDSNSPLYGSRPWGFVHDQILAEAPEELAHEAAHRMRDVMVEVANRYLPHVPMTADPVVSRCWSKDAEPVVLNGRLIPWSLSIRAYELALNEVRERDDAATREALRDAWGRLNDQERAAMVEAGKVL